MVEEVDVFGTDVGELNRNFGGIISQEVPNLVREDLLWVGVAG